MFRYNKSNFIKVIRRYFIKIIFLVLIIVPANKILGQGCIIEYVYPSSISFSYSGGFELVEFNIDIFCDVVFYNVPAWLDCDIILGMGTISCEANTGSARSATIGVGTQGYPEDYFYVYQAAPLSPGTISLSPTFVCYETAPGIISSVTPASGGDCSGNYSYQWQYSLNGSTFTNIVSETGLSYTPGVLTSNIWFRRKVTCQYTTSYSNTIQVTVNPYLNPGSINGNQSLCGEDNDPEILSQGSAVTGGGGSYSYIWQHSSNNGNSWSDIPGATATTYNPGTIYQSIYYKRIVYDGNGCNATSNEVQVYYDPICNSSNFIYTVEPLVAENNKTNINPLSYNEARRAVTYFDDFGRPIQNIAISASPSGYDIITPIEYDELGRESTKYLPYMGSGRLGSFADNAYAEDSAYYATVDNNIFQGEVAKAITVFENSPLNRVLAQGAPGTDWQPTFNESGFPTFNGHTQKFEYLSNSQHEVLCWEIDDNMLVSESGDLLSNLYYYPGHTLFKTVVKNENWSSTQTDLRLNTTEEFKDRQGKVVLKRTYNSEIISGSDSTISFDTYYVYDYFDRLRYVLPPKAVENINSATYSETSALIKDLCYYYKYDSRGRMIVKQLPGAEPVYMVYDSRDRLVLSQDGNLRNDTLLWLFTKYDTLNRPIMTGLYTHTSALGQEDMQTLVETSSNYLNEVRSDTAGNIFKYSNLAFPFGIDATDIHSVTYYDNYDFDTGSLLDSCLSVLDNRFPLSDISYCNTGMTTGSLVRVMDDDASDLSNDMIRSLMIYDKKGRLIRQYTDNHLGGSDIILSSYDFVGNLINSRRDHRVRQGISKIITEVENHYDHMGRLDTITERLDDLSIAGSELETSTVMTYNDLGILKYKRQGINGISELQKVDFKYNIRGWLTAINDGETGGSENDLWGMRLFYQGDLPGNSAPAIEAQYNGNISSMMWKSARENRDNAYIFSYDNLSRLTGANYNTFDGTDTWTASNAFDLSGVSYDLNGNIESLKRKDISGSLIDDLAYTYNTGNQLISIMDTVGNHSLGDFPGTAMQTYSYDYDVNGNLITDQAKGLTNIEYNYLNLPEKVTIDASHYIDYTYDASGNKLRKKVNDNGAITYRHYIGGIEYDRIIPADTTMDIINVSEGYIQYNNGNYDYNYILKDHLGNSRIVYHDSLGYPAILQNTSYYPFGLAIFDKNDNYKYLYNGKELQNDAFGGSSLNWYDYGARFYDPVVARFSAMDPHAENYLDLSPFAYVANNPIMNTDPDGMDIVYGGGEFGGDLYTGLDAQNLFKQLQSSFEGQQDPEKEDKNDQELSDQINEDPSKKNQAKEPNEFQKAFIEFILLADQSINILSDFLGGPTGENVTTVEKLQYHTLVYATGRFLVVSGRGINPGKRKIKIPNGFKEVPGVKSKSMPVYKKGNRYITPDIDSHIGGTWKMADSPKNLRRKATRMGTFNEDLTKKIGN